MGSLNVNHLPTIIDATLYRYNYLDYRMWAQMKNQLDYRDTGNDSIIISRAQLGKFISSNYQSSVNRMLSFGSHVPRKDATSIYFLHRVASEMINLKFIKLTLDSDKSYTRVVDTEGDKTIKYDFAIVKARLDLSEIFNFPELSELNAVLEGVELLSENKPYFNHDVNEIYARLDEFLDLNEENKASIECQMVVSLLDVIENSLDKENPRMLIITDYS